jgi:oligosaccharide repeat unit polymerase
MNIIVILLYSIISIFGVVGIWKFRKANPILWFIMIQWLLAVGTFILIDLEIVSHVIYVLSYFLSTIFFIFGVAIYWNYSTIKTAYKIFWNKNISIDRVSVRITVKVIAIISIIITILYYNATGINFFISIVTGNIIEDYTTSRLATYSGDKYYFPGYVNQFKNVMLPLCFSVLLAWAWYSKSKIKSWSLFFFGFPFLLYALLGTGQRAFLVYAYFASFLGISILTKIPKKIKYFIGLIALSIFSVFTFYYKSLDLSSPSIYYSVFIEIFKRIFFYQQEGGLIGFNYIYNLEITWFKEWFQGLVGILPGIQGSDIDHRIHAIMYGSHRGTVPLSFVGSSYHNGGILNVISISFIVGWVYSLIYHRLLCGSRYISRCFLYGALFFYLSILPLGSPISMINNGVVTLLILLFLRKFDYPTIIK